MANGTSRNAPYSLALVLTSTAPNNPFNLSIPPLIPTPQQASWSLQVQQVPALVLSTYVLQAVLVNRQYEVVHRIGPSNYFSGVTFPFDYRALGVGANELYRLYYVVYTYNGTLLYKGHGDVRYSPQ